MNNGFRLGLVAAGLALALHSGESRAVVATHQFNANAVNYCQAFTPGPANTIRNRVVGSENIGATMAVACDFHSMMNGGAGLAPPKQISMWFANNNTTGTITVTCSLLTGYQGQPSGYLVTKTTAAINAGGTNQQVLNWTAADNPTAGATNLGNYILGVNCTLPTGAVMNDTYILWDQDNGI